MISVIIPTFERPAALKDAVRDVLLQLPRGGELCVVDQSRAEVRRETARWIASLSDKRVVFHGLEHASLPNARNVGLARTSGAVVLFLDDDVRLSPACLSAHLAALQRPGVGGVTGRIVEHRVRPNSRRVQNRVTRSGRVLTRLDGFEPTSLHTLKGANMSYRREAITSAGLFDLRFSGTAFLEDADFSTRVRRSGWRLHFAPHAALEHLSVPSGGVRASSPLETERSRFHNTGYFVGKHRKKRDFLLVQGVFRAIALKRSLEWANPRASGILLRALQNGWRSAR